MAEEALYRKAQSLEAAGDYEGAIAQFTARVYPGGLQAPQGLGTGQLFTDNIESPLHIEGDQLWYNPVFLADSH